MKFEKGEYTTQSFLEFLTETFGTKLSGEAFNASDIAQYLSRGYTPHRYGNLKITSRIEKGVRIIQVKQEAKKK